MDAAPKLALWPHPEKRPSFEDFYQSTYPAALRLAYALVGWTNAPEDVVQEAFARVWRNFDGLENPGGYLRVTIVNLCRDGQRRQAHERTVPVAVAEPPPMSDATAEMVDVLMSLPYRQRAVLVLRYWGDFSEREIAEALGCRPGTVKTLAQRGLRRLRKVVGP